MCVCVCVCVRLYVGLGVNVVRGYTTQESTGKQGTVGCILQLCYHLGRGGGEDAHGPCQEERVEVER